MKIKKFFHIAISSIVTFSFLSVPTTAFAEEPTTENIECLPAILFLRGSDEDIENGYLDEDGKNRLDYLDLSTNSVQFSTNGGRGGSIKPFVNRLCSKNHNY